MPTNESCQLCEAPLEMVVDGQAYRFTAHTDELCRVATAQRIQRLYGALKSQVEVFEHSAREACEAARRQAFDEAIAAIEAYREQRMERFGVNADNDYRIGTFDGMAAAAAAVRRLCALDEKE